MQDRRASLRCWVVRAVGLADCLVGGRAEGWIVWLSDEGVVRLSLASDFGELADFGDHRIW